MANPAQQKIDAASGDDPSATLGRLVRGYVWPHRRRILLAVLCMVVVAGVTAANAKLMEPVFDDIFMARNRHMLMVLPLVILALAVVKAAASYGQFMLMRVVGQRIMSDMQLALYAHLLYADIALFTQEGPGRLISRFTNDIAMLRESLSNVITSLAKEAFTLIFLVGVMFYQSVALTLIAIVVFPLAVIPMRRIGQRMRRLSRQTQQELGQFTSRLDETFRSIRIVKAYRQEEREITRAQALIERVFALYVRGFRLKSASAPVMEMLAGFSVAAVVWYGGLRVIEGVTTPGAFLSFMTAVIMAYKPMRSMAGLNTTLQEGVAAAGRLFTMLDTQPQIEDRADAEPLVMTRGEITLDALSFHYGEYPAIEDVSLVIKPGTTVALVGPSGGGKSTLLNLLLRFYDPTAGRICVDGKDIRNVTLDSLRRQFALVNQATLLFDDSVLENIRYGRPDATDEDVFAAARAAAADSFITALPQGYHTGVGPHGTSLSGGQAQRIAIARALLTDAPVLLLDEATSALDAESERQVQQALDTLHHARTVIIVAHRLSTVRQADVIHVIEQGRLVESGTHESLLRHSGVYARLYDQQHGMTEDGPEVAAC